MDKLFLTRKSYDYIVTNYHNLARRLQKEFTVRNWSVAGVTYHGISNELVKEVEKKLSEQPVLKE
jgi:hypothetical protein